ncbi:unnamed protein product [Amoebophrya sp. A25]|nr:unnamed protein product [Amoebophrya sp. A25]|eukprot:GSA25T00012235001.1
MVTVTAECASAFLCPQRKSGVWVEAQKAFETPGIALSSAHQLHPHQYQQHESCSVRLSSRVERTQAASSFLSQNTTAGGRGGAAPAQQRRIASTAHLQYPATTASTRIRRHRTQKIAFFDTSSQTYLLPLRTKQSKRGGSSQWLTSTVSRGREEHCNLHAASMRPPSAKSLLCGSTSTCFADETPQHPHEETGMERSLAHGRVSIESEASSYPSKQLDPSAPSAGFFSTQAALMSGNFNESKSYGRSEPVPDYFRGSRKSSVLPSVLQQAASSLSLSSKQAGSYRGKLRESKGPDVLVRGTEDGTRPGGGLNWTYKANEALLNLLQNAPEIAAEKVKVLRKHFASWEDKVLFSRSPKWKDKIDVARLLSAPFTDRHVDDPHKFVFNMVNELGPDVVARSTGALRLYRQLGLYAVGQAYDLAQDIKNFTTGPLEMVRDVGQGFLNALNIGEDVKNLQAMVQSGLLSLARDAAAWRIQPQALMAWPAYFFLQAYRLSQTPDVLARHSYHFGAKIMKDFASPSILETDLFDVRKWNCRPRRGSRQEVASSSSGQTDGSDSPPALLRAADAAAGAVGEALQRQLGLDEGQPVAPQDILRVHPSITFRAPQHLVHVRLEELQTSGTASPPPCGVYWDAVYDLKGATELTHEEIPIGGEWPLFAHVCRRPLEPPRRFTQWIEFLSPREVVDEWRNPMAQRMKHVLCDGKVCRVDSAVHPVRPAPPGVCSADGRLLQVAAAGEESSKMMDGKEEKMDYVGKRGDCNMCNRENLPNMMRCYSESERFSCRPGQTWFRNYIDDTGGDDEDHGKQHADPIKQHEYTTPPIASLEDLAKRRHTLEVKRYLAGECRVRGLQRQQEVGYVGWCNANADGTPGVARTFVLRVDNGDPKNLIASAQVTYYDKESLRNSYDFLSVGGLAHASDERQTHEVVQQ